MYPKHKVMKKTVSYLLLIVTTARHINYTQWQSMYVQIPVTGDTQLIVQRDFLLEER